MATRKDELASRTIFDIAAARHAATSATPAATAMPAAGSADHTFITAVWTLLRSRFDEAVAKHVQKNCFGAKHVRFTTGTESNVATVFTRMVAALKEAFIAEDATFTSLFKLTNAAVTVRLEANMLLYSILELLVDPDSAAADWLECSALAFPQDGKRMLLEFARRLMQRCVIIWE
ncbi:hypothetical protein CYMTET_13379 [Cymbomonas tetramitiformis]|uniref:Uncharacterized protein n=1 Tax=Cymbomonas tetramitiformis TaxID=36881 RepID=A0AAE0LB53_9CHLO|nr:hypothetical protein CYMTET_13379 [Cymbomonas tetramitiformis]